MAELTQLVDERAVRVARALGAAPEGDAEQPTKLPLATAECAKHRHLRSTAEQSGAIKHAVAQAWLVLGVLLVLAWAGSAHRAGSSGDRVHEARPAGSLSGMHYRNMALATAATTTLTAASALASTQGQAGCIVSAGGATPPTGAYRAIAAINTLGQWTGGVAVTAEGTLRMWGLPDISGSTPTGGGFVAVTSGAGWALALRGDGTLAAWGTNTHGPLAPPSGERFRAIASFDWHTVGLRTDGSILCWGDNTFGRCASPPGNDYVAVGAGSWHSLAIRADGTPVAWGYNNVGQCTVPQGLKMLRLTGSTSTSFGIRLDGSLTAWGANGDGVMNGLPTSGKYVDVAFNVANGAGGGIALRDDGVVVTWPSPTVPLGTIARSICCGYLIADGDCNGDGIADARQCRTGTLADFDGNDVPDCCERGVACVVGSHPVEWRASDGGNGHWYEVHVFDRPTRWLDARAAAQALGGDLASLESAGEPGFVDRLAGNPVGWGSRIGPWLGGFQDTSAGDFAEPAGGWRWTSGAPWQFTAWGPGEPNDSPSPENFLHFISNNCPGYPDGRFYNDVRGDFGDIGPCDKMPIGAIIEWSADCNNDGIVDYGQILRGELADANGNGVPDVCECRACDLFRDGQINGADLAILLSQWGPADTNTVSDINHDSRVDGYDLSILLAHWGSCGP